MCTHAKARKHQRQKFTVRVLTNVIAKESILKGNAHVFTREHAIHRQDIYTFKAMTLKLCGENR